MNSVLLVSIVLQASSAWSLSQVSPFHASGTTVYEYNGFPQNFIARTKRSFVFCKGTSVILTMVVAKQILAAYPRPVIISSEIDLMFDVPLYVDGWRKPLTSFVKKMQAKVRKNENIDSGDKILENVGRVNASAIPLREYNKLAVGSWDGVNFYHNSHKKMRPYYKTNSFKSNSRLSPYQAGERRQYKITPPRYHSKGSTNRQIPLWHHHREYRERRDIYEYIDKIGKMVGRSLRKCVMRAICEMKKSLLPEGVSFINDVARIIFTVPTDHDNTDDEFTKIAMEENVDCKRRFMVTCPQSPLEYILKYFAKT